MKNFRRLNADRINTPAAFVPVAADFGFEFKLACQDPSGNPTNGIVRKMTSKTNFSFSSTSNLADENALGIKTGGITGDLPWPTEKYLNIWVVDFSGSILGYGTFPSDYPARPQFDGIVIKNTAFGRIGNVTSPFNKGRTASHEVGHWLSLRHIWGDAACGNDFVADTPLQSGPNSNCPAFPHPSGCNGSGPNGDMFMNYMDYTDDACLNIFTSGQRFRGKAIFSTGGPRAAFINNYFQIVTPLNPIRCQESIRLFNPTCSGPVTWSVISGPAIIAGGQGTNEVIIKASGTGQATIRATGGNYLSDLLVDVNQTAVPINLMATQQSCNELIISTNSQYFTNFQWSVQSGDILFNGSTTTATTTNPYIIATGTFGAISVIGTNLCNNTTASTAGYSLQFPPSLKDIENYIPYPEPNCYQAEGFYFFKATDFGTEPTDYLWGYNFNGGPDVFVPTNGVIQQYLFPSAGNYEIFVRPRNECISGNKIVKQIVVQGDCINYEKIKINADTLEYSIFPNPATDRITVTTKQGNYPKESTIRHTEIRTVTIYDKQGTVRKRFSYPPMTKSVNLDVSSLPLDIYMLEIQNGIKRYQKLISIQR